jgi:hypothetical protein
LFFKYFSQPFDSYFLAFSFYFWKQRSSYTFECRNNSELISYMIPFELLNIVFLSKLRDAFDKFILLEWIWKNASRTWYFNFLEKCVCLSSFNELSRLYFIVSIVSIMQSVLRLCQINNSCLIFLLWKTKAFRETLGVTS